MNVAFKYEKLHFLVWIGGKKRVFFFFVEKRVNLEDLEK